MKKEKRNKRGPLNTLLVGYSSTVAWGILTRPQVGDFEVAIRACATKFAVRAITDGLRMDLMGKKIRVTNIEPGLVETEFSLVRAGGDEAKAEAVYKGFKPLQPEAFTNP